MTAAVAALAAVLVVVVAAASVATARGASARRTAKAEGDRRRALEGAVAQLGASLAQLRARYPSAGDPAPAGEAAPPGEPVPAGDAAPAGGATETEPVPGEDGSGGAGSAPGRTLEGAAGVAARPGEHSLVATAWALVDLARRRAEPAELPAPAPAPGSEGPAGLEAALTAEVARIREEVGTPGSVRCVLDEPPSPGVSLVTLHALHLILETLARRSNAFDLYVHEWESRVAAIVVCDGFDGRGSVKEAAAEIDSVLRPCGGALDLDRDSRDRLRARLSVPRDAG